MADLSLITLLLAVICFCMVVTTSLFFFAARRLNALLAHGDALLGRVGSAADWVEETLEGAYRKIHSFFQGVFGNGSRPKARRVRGLRNHSSRHA